ncbi:TetR/AcrR family transcriptional regulator [Iamia sp. SCSIO 61187]|uniref:TetR/AcrR family transcriptional regulator n=1 Tax=Iamia sp. SCSIO 61187 TaxID=2722752 RepID=UPI001C625A18|nr:TetR/AcrR family transcriptional regulator [Iamia sp. SCSIO 61187]
MDDASRNGPQSAPIPVDLRTGPARPRRADAERNRARLLDAARALVAEQGLEGTTMDALAARAGVGKGTVYRAFGSRGGVAEALVDAVEHRLQGAILDGPPPLGRGAPPEERIAAFADAFLRMVEDEAEVLVEVDHGAPGRRFGTGAYAFWGTHLSGLAREAGCRQPDIVAELVLGLLAADLHRHLRDDLAFGPITRRRETVAAVRAVVADSVARAP